MNVDNADRFCFAFYSVSIDIIGRQFCGTHSCCCFCDCRCLDYGNDDIYKQIRFSFDCQFASYVNKITLESSKFLNNSCKIFTNIDSVTLKITRNSIGFVSFYLILFLILNFIFVSFNSFVRRFVRPLSKRKKNEKILHSKFLFSLMIIRHEFTLTNIGSAIFNFHVAIRMEQMVFKTKTHSNNIILPYIESVNFVSFLLFHLLQATFKVALSHRFV